MSSTRITVRVDSGRLKRAQKALGAKTASETVDRALTLVTEKAAHDQVVRRYGGVGKPDAFREE
jgi:Arc/MetJ family transcription regulator